MTSKKDYPDRINWNLAGIILFFSYLVFFLLRLNLFPVFLDIYYHIGVMQGFDLARGIVTWDFWEFASIGRPHFYPPLLHILMLVLYKLGVSKINIAIFSSFIIFPLFILTFWYVVKKIFGSRLAFFVILSLLSSYSLFLGLTNTIAGTFCLTLLLLLFYALHKDKKISSVILTALLFYTHYAISIMGVLALGLYFLFEKEKKAKLFLIAAGIIMALPWIINFACNIGYLGRSIHYEKGVEINLPLLAFSIIGFFLCLRLKGAHLFFIFLLLAGFTGTFKLPYSNYSYEAGMFAAFTERANATMSPYNIPISTSNMQKHINNAKLILWLKNTEGVMEPELSSLIRDMRLEKIAETRMFYIYRNPAATPKMKISHAVLPMEISFLLVFVLFGLIGWDLLKKE
ncbi:MAG: glycosyltransferase family 39 protein [Candidatus Omnitrophica bacterium]|nr:glycosyltransferase family 39 protein [Candidatus Omnitrophota bacterium]